MIKVSFFNDSASISFRLERRQITERRVRDMLTNLLVFWVLASLFFGSRSAGRAVSVLFGFMVFFWVMRILFKFGLMLLPIILVVLVFSKVVVPFVVTFLRHFQ